MLEAQERTYRYRAVSGKIAGLIDQGVWKPGERVFTAHLPAQSSLTKARA